MTIVSKSLVLQGQIKRALLRQVTGLFLCMAITASFFAPNLAYGAIFPIFSRTAQADISGPQASSVLQPAMGPLAVASSKSLTIASEVRITGGAIAPTVGPMSGAINMMALSQNSGRISVYTVRPGDTISTIAEMFGVTRATIISANSLEKSGSISVGQELVIFPMSGYGYTVRKGDTLATISERVNVSPADIAFYNDLDATVSLKAGDKILIPDAEHGGETISSASSVATAPDTRSTFARFISDTLSLPVRPMKDASKRNLGKVILRPVSIEKGIISQGAHGWGKTAVDIAAPSGTPVVAALDGKVLVARSEGYNDGYGRYIILASEVNGVTVETIYAHLSKITISAGETVERGQTIGLVGSTGDSTGNHLHFEVRGALNPLVLNAKYTGE